MYEITLFTFSKKDFNTIYNGYLAGDPGLSYYEIIACSMYELLKDCKFKIVHTQDTKETIREDGKFYLQEYDTVGTFPYVQDIDTCFMVTNLQTKDYFFVDFQDGPVHCMNYIQNKNCIGIFTPQHKHIYQYLETGSLFEHSHKNYPLCFFSSAPFYTEKFVDKIKNIRENEKLIPKMFFSGNFYDGYEYFNPRKKIYESNRAVVKALVEKYPDWIDTKARSEASPADLQLDEYYTKVASYAVPLAMPGHPWSHREHEFWSMGIPTLSNTYTCSLLQPLIPNFHYIDAGTTGKDVRDREVDVELAADLIFKRFKEVYLNRDYLNWVSKNILKRYKSFSSPTKVAQYIFSTVNDILEIKNREI